MPLLETTGAASAKGFGLLSSVAAPVYIEDVMSVFLYTGNSSTQTITNGIDLSGKGGLVWLKSRDAGADNHRLFDTNRGIYKGLVSNLTAAEDNYGGALTAFNSNGFSINNTSNITNVSPYNYVSWTFRKAAKFFDVVTYTGNGVAGRTVAHNLGSVPGCMIIKQYSASGQDWPVYHRSLGATYVTWLNLTNASSTSRGGFAWNNTAPTSTVFTVGDGGETNSNGTTYVAYLFAHDAGGFGASGSDNVITCGSYTGNGSTTGPVVTLGYEPQWLMIKDASGTGSWVIFDTMRGLPVTDDNSLVANDPAAENGILGAGNFVNPTATGFSIVSTNGNLNDNTNTYIYIAIRRGPMKTPTTGTSVFVPVTQTLATGSFVNTGFVTDMGLSKALSTADPILESRLTKAYLRTNTTGAESSGSSTWDYMNGYGPTPWSGAGLSSVAYGFRRAPGFFDVVCYTGDGTSTRNVSHNLSVAPELIILKRRDASVLWPVWASLFAGTNDSLVLNTNAAKTGSGLFTTGSPTATTFVIANDATTNTTNGTYVAYLFATVAGVSKVGSYTGTGNTLQIDCGFTGGARFVLIKRTDSTGDWYVWDSARGIVAGNDPYLLLNSTAAEVTSTDYVDTYSAGFEISSAAPAAINANGGSFIFLAIA